MPKIVDFKPTSGRPGDTVTITGSAFTGATSVTLKGTPSDQFTVDSYGQITATVPSRAETGRIAVITPGGRGKSTSDFTVIGASPGVGTQYHVVADVPYRVVGDVTLTLDVYFPLRPGQYQALLLIHPGGFKSGDKSAVSSEAARLTDEGFVAFVPNYRLACPSSEGALCGYRYPAHVQDVRAAVGWVRMNGGLYGADTTRVGALGFSAGGNLAYMVGDTGSPGFDRVDAAAGWSGPEEFSICGQNPSGSTQECSAEQNYLGCSLSACPDLWAEASPISHVDATSAPTYIANSDQEFIYVQEAYDYAGALGAAGVPYQLRIIPGKKHSTSYEGQVWDETVAFLHANL